jgi:WD40 repeat protein
MDDSDEEQKFNEHYESITSFKAHDGLILASAFTKYKDKATLVTGGNDNTIVIWEAKDCTEPNAVAKRSNNGWWMISNYDGSANFPRPHGGVTTPVYILSHRVITAKIPR